MAQDISRPNKLSLSLRTKDFSEIVEVGSIVSCVVEKITEEVIEEVVQAFINEQDEAYWLKVYSSASHFTINELNKVVQRQNEEEI